MFKTVKKYLSFFVKFDSRIFLENIELMGQFFWAPALFLFVEFPIFFKKNIRDNPALVIAAPLYIATLFTSLFVASILLAVYLISSLFSSILGLRSSNLGFYFYQSLKNSIKFISSIIPFKGREINKLLEFPIPNTTELHYFIGTIDCQKFVDFIHNALSQQDSLRRLGEGFNPYDLINRLINQEMEPQDSSKLIDLVMIIRNYYNSLPDVQINGESYKDPELYDGVKKLVALFITNHNQETYDPALMESIDELFTNFNTHNTIGVNVLQAIPLSLIKQAKQYKANIHPLVSFMTKTILDYNESTSDIEEITFVNQLIEYAFEYLPAETLYDICHHLGRLQVIDLVRDMIYQPHIILLLKTLKDNLTNEEYTDADIRTIINQTIDHIQQTLVKTELTFNAIHDQDADAANLRNQLSATIRKTQELIRTLTDLSHREEISVFQAVVALQALPLNIMLNHDLLAFLIARPTGASTFVTRCLNIALDGDRCYFKRTADRAPVASKAVSANIFTFNDLEKEHYLASLIEAALKDEESLGRFLAGIAHFNYEQEDQAIESLHELIGRKGHAGLVMHTDAIRNEHGLMYFLSNLNNILASPYIRDALTHPEKRYAISMFIAELVIMILNMRTLENTPDRPDYGSTNDLAEIINQALATDDTVMVRSLMSVIAPADREDPVDLQVLFNQLGRFTSSVHALGPQRQAALLNTMIGGVDQYFDAIGQVVIDAISDGDEAIVAALTPSLHVDRDLTVQLVRDFLNTADFQAMLAEPMNALSLTTLLHPHPDWDTSCALVNFKHEDLQLLKEIEREFFGEESDLFNKIQLLNLDNYQTTTLTSKEVFFLKRMLGGDSPLSAKLVVNYNAVYQQAMAGLSLLNKNQALVRSLLNAGDDEAAPLVSFIQQFQPIADYLTQLSLVRPYYQAFNAWPQERKIEFIQNIMTVCQGLEHTTQDHITADAPVNILTALNANPHCTQEDLNNVLNQAASVFIDGFAQTNHVNADRRRKISQSLTYVIASFVDKVALEDLIIFCNTQEFKEVLSKIIHRDKPIRYTDYIELLRLARTIPAIDNVFKDSVFMNHMGDILNVLSPVLSWVPHRLKRFFVNQSSQAVRVAQASYNAGNALYGIAATGYSGASYVFSGVCAVGSSLLFDALPVFLESTRPYGAEMSDDESDDDEKLSDRCSEGSTGSSGRETDLEEDYLNGVEVHTAYDPDAIEAAQSIMFSRTDSADRPVVQASGRRSFS